MGCYLILESGNYVQYNQISHNEVEIERVTLSEAHSFYSLEEARQAAKSINENKDGEFTLYSAEKVIAVIRKYSLE